IELHAIEGLYRRAHSAEARENEAIFAPRAEGSEVLSGAGRSCRGEPAGCVVCSSGEIPAETVSRSCGADSQHETNVWIRAWAGVGRGRSARGRAGDLRNPGQLLYGLHGAELGRAAAKAECHVATPGQAGAAGEYQRRQLV